MTVSFAAKALVLLLFLGSTLYVHLRGKARLPVCVSSSTIRRCSLRTTP